MSILLLTPVLAAAGPRRLLVAGPLRRRGAVFVDELIIGALRRRFPRLGAPKADDVWCATQNRQDAVRGVARGADLVLVGGLISMFSAFGPTVVGHRDVVDEDVVSTLPRQVR